MKLFARILAALLCVTAAQAQDVRSTQPAAGQYPGTATNDSASAGNVGELLTSTCPSGNATITVTIASPAVVTYTAHGFSNTAPASDVCPIVFTNSGGALPTGITSGTTYWTVPSSYTTNTFQIATSAANAIAGTSVNTSGSQSGTQTGTRGSALSTGVAITTAARALTVGDWDVWCTFRFNPAATTTTNQLIAEVSPTDNTLALALGNFATAVFSSAGVTTGLRNETFTTPLVPLRLSGTTNYYCVGDGEFATSTMTADGKLVARRRR